MTWHFRFRSRFTLRTLLSALTVLAVPFAFWGAAWRHNASLLAYATDLRRAGATCLITEYWTGAAYDVQSPNMASIGWLQLTEVAGGGEIDNEGNWPPNHLANLTSFVCGSEGLNDTGLSRILTPARNLRELSVRGTNISDRSVPLICSLRELEILSVSGTSLSEAALQKLSSLPQLKELTLAARPDGLAFRPFGDGEIRIEQLTILSPEENPRAPRLNASFPKLQGFRIVGTFTDDDLIELATRAPNVSRLEIEGGSITARGLAAAANLPLKRVELQVATIDDEALAALADCSGLVHLSVSGATITPAGIKHLERSNISTLWVDGENLDDSVAESLSKMLFLKSVYLAPFNLSPEAHRALLEKRPGLEIIQ